MKIKKILPYLIIIVIFLGVNISAQNTQSQEKKESISNLKKKYFREHLIIQDDSKAKTFWIFFDEYVDKEATLYKDFVKKITDSGIKKEKSRIDFNNLPDQKIWIYLDIKHELGNSLFINENEFYQKIKKCLSGKEAVDYFNSDKAFKTELVKLKEKRKNN